MAGPHETAMPSLWFEGSVAAAVEAANTKGSVLLVCLVNDTTDGSESNLFERRFTEARIASELSGLNLVALRLIKDSPDGMMFGQIFPVIIVPSLYLIRNGLLADFMNSTVDMDSMLERIKKAVDGHFQIPPPPSTVLPVATTSTANTSGADSLMTGTSVSAPTSGTETAQATHPIVEATSSPTVGSSTTSPHGNTAGSSSSSAAPAPPRVDQAQALKDLMKERKLKREKEEREAQKQREIDRRSSSKALSDAQGELKDKQNKKLKDQIEKEKREEAEYKKRVKQALEEDKARRRAEKEKARAASAAAAAQSSPLLTPGEIQSQNAGLTQARNDAAPALAYDSSRLNIRLFDGSSIRNIFKATDTLEEVRRWIDENQKDCEDAYNIVQLIPSRTFTDESKMLRDLELCPSATLVLKKTATTSSAYKGSEDGAVPTLLSYGRSALSLAGKVASSAYSTVSYYNPLASAAPSSSGGSSSSSGTSGPSRASESARSKKKDTEVHYNGNSTSLE